MAKQVVNRVLQSAPGDWIVRIKRRRDGKKYYFRHDCCTTARKESSMLMAREVAEGLAHAIATKHPDFTAWATPYNSGSKQHRKHAANVAKMADAMSAPADAVACSLVPMLEEASKCQK